jgi:hypothetical protein
MQRRSEGLRVFAQSLTTAGLGDCFRLLRMDINNGLLEILDFSF